MFNSILTDASSTLDAKSVIICMLASVVLGLVIALVHMKTSKYSKNFVITLSVLPLLVQVVILMVNGNLGTSVAVLGAFSLVRFRSIPGNSKEIIFFAMAVGLAVGMGQLVLAAIITVVVSLMLIIFSKINLNKNKGVKQLKVLIPEDLDYTNIFDDIFNKYTESTVLQRVKTTNMGSMFELNYDVELKNNVSQKDFIDALRVKNGNLNITLSREISNQEEL